MTEVEIENKVAGVVAGHKMAGFDVSPELRAKVRGVIVGDIDGDDAVARLVADAKARNASDR